MSKGKIISIPTSVEAQIRTRARNLPIDKCYISKNWEKTRDANFIIVRKHTNGNITMGIFRVDLRLRCVRECTYEFNESPLRLDELLERFPNLFEECDYNLAHNIILAGVEFAEDYGFSPHKNFKTAQYILEEDTDDIPVIEIPLGDNGIPVLVIPYGETCEREMAILNKTAGDNYNVVYLDKDGKPKIEESTYMEIFNEVLETGVDEYMNKSGDSQSKTETQVLVDLIYIARVFTEEEREQIDNEFERIIKDTRLTMAYTPEKDYEEELEQALDYFIDGKTDEAIAESRKVIGKYPEEPLLWDIFLYNLSIDSDKVDVDAVKEAFSLFPEHPNIKAWYSEWLAQEDRVDEIFALFNHLPGLDALTTEYTFINDRALTSFCFAYTMAWLNKKDLLRAEPYYQVIARLGLDYRMGGYIQTIITDLKRIKIKEMAEAGMFGDDGEAAI